MSMKEQGVDAIGAAIQRNIDQARYLERLVNADPDLELLAPVPMNIVCFRYAPAGLAPERLNALNQDILIALQSRGIAVPSQTVLEGRFAIRVCITNHRSEDHDFDLLVTSVKQIAAELLG
jgi:glutamate/tyrosine decarboxylase-like PLP-dependent enzyme